MSNLTDEQLVDKYLKGDEKALEILIQKYLNQVFGLAFKYLLKNDEAEDITQEVFIKVWKNIKKFKNTYQFKNWIFSITRNTCLDYLKKKNRPIPFCELDNKETELSFADSLADKSPSILEVLQNQEVIKTLNFAVERLNPEYRQALDLRYNQALKFKDIAELLKEPLNTVKTRCRRAVDKLKDILPNIK